MLPAPTPRLWRPRRATRLSRRPAQMRQLGVLGVLGVLGGARPPRDVESSVEPPPTRPAASLHRRGGRRAPRWHNCVHNCQRW